GSVTGAPCSVGSASIWRSSGNTAIRSPGSGGSASSPNQESEPQAPSMSSAAARTPRPALPRMRPIDPTPWSTLPQGGRHGGGPFPDRRDGLGILGQLFIYDARLLDVTAPLLQQCSQLERARAPRIPVGGERRQHADQCGRVAA